MGVFDIFKSKKPDPWDDAYEAKVKFYAKPDSTPFGALSLVEDTATVLPEEPQYLFESDGRKVTEWKLILVSLSKDCVLGAGDYFDALRLLENHITDRRDSRLLLRPLGTRELEKLARLISPRE